MLKSLEIVNEFIENIEDTMKEIKSGPFHDIRLLDLNKFKTIKQDLELLEELIKLVMEFDGLSSVYLIGCYQAKIKQRVGDNS